MPSQEMHCPHCGQRMEAGSREGRVCPACRQPVNVSDQSLKNDPAPVDAGHEIPELSTSHGKLRAVRAIALTMSLLSIVVMALLLFQMLGAVQPQALIVVAVLALGSAFVWFYTQFAITMKSSQ